MNRPDMGGLRVELADAATSRAVLIGVSRYSELDQLPAVANNIDSMEAMLTDPELWGLPKANCRVLRDPTTVDEVLEAVHQAATEATDTLVVYYAGHGIPDDKSDLYLALPDSSPDRLFKAVRYDDIRREVVTTGGRCRGKVVILDCCYSGRAMLGGMSGPAQIADHARIDGTYLMTASAETSMALAPLGEKFTAFTGALVDALSNGLPDGPDLLDMETLYWHVRAELEAKRCPIPQQRTRNDGKEIALVRNRRGLRIGSEPVKHTWSPTAAPVGFERIVRAFPRDFVAEVTLLRESGRADVADQLLEATGGRRDEQETATLVGLLSQAGMQSCVDTMIRTVVRRPPPEIVSIVDAMREAGQSTHIDQLIRAASAGPTDEIAALAVALRDAHYAVEFNALLDLSAKAAPSTSAMITLVGAFSAGGLRIEVDEMLGRAAAGLTGKGAAALADALRAAGRNEAAFRLYVDAIDSIRDSPPADLSLLISAMRQAGRVEYAERVLWACCTTRTEPQPTLDLVIALWANDLVEDADRVINHAAETFSDEKIIILARGLRDHDRQRDAYRLLFEACRRRPLTGSLVFVETLREAGRPVDANRLLEASALTRPPLEVAELLTDLRRSESHADAERVINVATQAQLTDMTQVAHILLGATDDYELGWILQKAARQPIERITDLLNTLRAAGKQAGKNHMIRAIATYAELETIVKVCENLSSRGHRVDGETLIAEAAASRTPDQVTQLAGLLRNAGLHMFTRVLPRDKGSWSWRRIKTTPDS